MTAVEQVIKLIVWMSEFVKAKLPEASILEGAVGYLPRLEPIRASKAHQQEDARDKSDDGSIEQHICNTHKKLT